MASIVKSLRILGDTNRLRMVLLLAREELSVAELQEILAMGQSTHLHALGPIEACRPVGGQAHGEEYLVPVQKWVRNVRTA